MEKEGLESALDFTKYLTAISGGGVGFLLNYKIDSGSFTCFDRVILTLALLLFCASVFSGLAVLSGGAVMLSNKNYSLNDPYVLYPGRINLFAFAAAVAAVGIIVFRGIW